MTSKIKCPVCQNNLHKINVVVSTCTNDKCKLWGSPIPNLVLEALTQAKQDLEQSKKCCSAWEIQALDYKAETIALSCKLEIVRKALEEISSHYQDDIGKPTFVNWYFTAKKMCDCADKALEQIEHIADVSKMIGQN